MEMEQASRRKVTIRVMERRMRRVSERLSWMKMSVCIGERIYSE